MDLRDIIDIAEAYSKLGWSIQRQVEDVLQGDIEGCNGNALRHIIELLETIGRIDRGGELSDECQGYIDQINARLTQPDEDEEEDDEEVAE